MDPDLGMYYLRARYYQPVLGRFWNMDSFEGDMEEPASLHKYLYCHANPINGVNPSGHDFGVVSFSIASSISQGLQGNYDGGVSAMGNTMKNTIVGVWMGYSMGAIIALNILDNTGGLIAGKALAQLRRLPGVAKGVGKMVQGGRWLRGSNANAGYAPASVAKQLAGRNFKTFDEFRKEFWKAVAEDVELAASFKANDLARMRNGNAPLVDKAQSLGSRRSYELHHAKPIQHGGDVYDLDNIVVVTPRYHKEILEPAYHF